MSIKMTKDLTSRRWLRLGPDYARLGYAFLAVDDPSLVRTLTHAGKIAFERRVRQVDSE
jgi:hypothetical protein